MPSEKYAADVQKIEELTRQHRFQEAEAECRKLVQQAPEVHEAWAWWGVLALVQGQCDVAETALRRAIALWDQDGDYWMNLALALRSQKKLADAEACARRAVELDPARAPFWVGLGTCYIEMGRHDEAVAALDRALVCDSDHAPAWSNLAAAEQGRGRLDAATIAYEQAIRINPQDLDALAKYGYVLVQRGKVAKGFEVLNDLTKAAPTSAAIWQMLGSAYRFVSDFPQAEAALREALLLAPQSREIRHQLAHVLLARSALTEALRIVRQLVTENQEDAAAWSLQGAVQSVMAQPAEAIFSLQKSLSLAPNRLTHSKLLLTCQFSDRAAPERLLEQHLAWDAAYASPLRSQVPPGVPKRGQLQCIGFVAPDFCKSPTGFLALHALEQLRETGLSIVCYADGGTDDEYTARFRAAADLWRPTLGWSDENLANQVRRDQVDILVDLSGHTGSRLLVFARRPGPLQVTWLGYVGTTGLKAIDYLLADSYHVRSGEEAWYAEQVLRMSHDYICYSPPPSTPAVSPLPALATGIFTYGCFNIPAKYSPPIVAAWAEILRRVPHSRLLLKNFALADEGLRNQLHGRFAQHGVAPERVLLEGPSSQIDTMAAYQRVDLALDTQPYSGGLTTCEALWMGVPVVTCPGKTFAGRHATSHSINAGLAGFVVEASDYIDAACTWPSRLSELSAIRGSLREQVRSSPLCDARSFAAELAGKLQEIWRQKCG